MFQSKLWHTENGSYRKYPINACGVRDSLSGDMLMSSRCSLFFSLPYLIEKATWIKCNL